MSVTDDKKALRKELIRRRSELPSDEKAAVDERIFLRLLPFLEECSGVFTYVSTDIEVDTHRLLEWCFSHGKPVAVPVSGDSELVFYGVGSFGELAPGRFGIMEPVNRSTPAVPDSRSLCIVPALQCSKDGYRIGYGRGYYDRYLADFPGRSLVICYSGFIGNVPTEPHDRRADMLITD